MTAHSCGLDREGSSLLPRQSALDVVEAWRAVLFVKAGLESDVEVLSCWMLMPGMGQAGNRAAISISPVVLW